MKKSVSPEVFLKLVGGEKGKEWILSGKTSFRLGRGEGSDVELPYPWVSRQHAMIQVEENFSHNIIDLGSSNGTKLNGRRVYTPCRLRSGDRIHVGNTELIFIIENWVSPESEEDETSGVGNETVAFLQKGDATILVCDIRGFTSLSEEVGADHLSKFLTVWSKKIDSIVRKYDGRVDKFIGDAVLAVWPGQPDFDRVIKSLFAALEISVWTMKIGRKIPGITKDIQIGAAINSGEAVIGNVGVDGQRDSTIVGDAVNVAFRLQEMTSRQKIDLLIGEQAYRHLRDTGQSFSSHKMSLKGKAGEVIAFSASFAVLWQYLAKWQSFMKK